MNAYIISDSHFNHDQIATYCDRPSNFTEVIIRNWKRIVQPTDLVLHVGDVFIGKAEGWKKIYPELPGRKILIRGNHDRHHGCMWWMENGFDFACDAMIFRHVYITHKPANFLPSGCELNLHGHLHNIWHGFHHGDPGTERITKSGRLKNPWQRLFAVEYTDYCPVEFEKFMSHPDKYQARGPEKKPKLIMVDIESSTGGGLIYPDKAVHPEAAKEFKEKMIAYDRRGKDLKDKILKAQVIY